MISNNNEIGNDSGFISIETKSSGVSFKLQTTVYVICNFEMLTNTLAGG